MTDAILRCPRDQANLAFEGYWKHPRYRCTQCGGYLLSHAGILAMLKHTDRRRLPGAGLDDLTKLPPSGLACPRDAGPLRTVILEGAELGVCASCTSVWVAGQEFQKLAGREKEIAEEAHGDSVDYVALMASRRWVTDRFALPPLLGGFGGIFILGGTCRGWQDLDPYFPLAIFFFACIVFSFVVLVFWHRCPKCDHLLVADDGIDLIANECHRCGAVLR
jgi:Zn-finger nucleic acid-binding protein